MFTVVLLYSPWFSRYCSFFQICMDGSLSRVLSALGKLTTISLLLQLHPYLFPSFHCSQSLSRSQPTSPPELSFCFPPELPSLPVIAPLPFPRSGSPPSLPGVDAIRHLSFPSSDSFLPSPSEPLLNAILFPFYSLFSVVIPLSAHVSPRALLLFPSGTPFPPCDSSPSLPSQWQPPFPPRGRCHSPPFLPFQ